MRHSVQKIVSKWFSRAVTRVRPSAVVALGSVPLSTAVGWYARKAVLPFARWVVRAPLLGPSQGVNFIGRSVKIVYAKELCLGGNVFIGDFSLLNCFSAGGIHFARGVTVREFCWLQGSSNPGKPGESLVIKEDTYVGPRAIFGVGGPVRIGARCQIGANLTLVAENHAIRADGSVSSVDVVRQGVSIGDDCWLGHGVTILDGVVLGDGVVVAAGAVVTKSFGDGSRVAGVPAELMAERVLR